MGDAPASLGHTLDVVFVCTGNRARSPYAAAAFARATSERAVEVRSAGTMDLGPVPALPEVVDLAARRRLDLSEHRAHGLIAGELAGASLVVGFEPIHLTTAIVEGRAPSNRTFSIVELARLLPEARAAAGPSARLERVLDAVHQRSSKLTAPSVADPFGGSRSQFERMADELDSLVAQLAEGLFGDPVGRRDPRSSHPGRSWLRLVRRTPAPGAPR